MKKRNIGIISTLMVFSITIMMGCPTTYLDMKNWEGRTNKDLYFE